MYIFKGISPEISSNISYNNGSSNKGCTAFNLSLKYTAISRLFFFSLRITKEKVKRKG